MAFSMVQWGFWSQEWLYPFPKASGQSQRQRNFSALPLVEFSQRHCVETPSGTAFSWVKYGWEGHRGKLQEGPTLPSFPLMSLNPAPNSETSLGPRKICLTSIWVSCPLYLVLFMVLYQKEHLLTISNDLSNGYTHIATISVKREDISISPESSLVPLCSQTSPPPRPGKRQYNFHIFFSLSSPLYF